MLFKTWISTTMLFLNAKKALHKECVHEQYTYMYKQKLQLNHPTTTGSLNWKAITYTISQSHIVIITDNIFV